MHTTVHYTEGTREEKDARAICDIQEYLDNEAKFQLLVDLAQEIDGNECTVQQLNRAMGIAGISGRPFHAFCRKYCLEQYINWLRSDVGGEPVECDAQGFREGEGQ